MSREEMLCAQIAEKQFGLISRQQAIGAGLSARAIDRRVEAKRWHRVLRGVYRMAGTPLSWEQSLMGATLWGGEQCVVSHRAAAALHGLDGFRKGPVEVQSRTRLRHSRITTHRTRAVLGHYEVRGIPVTSVTRTLIDLAGSVSRETLEKALDEAIRRRMTDIGRVRRVLAQSGSRMHGRRVLRRFIEARDCRGEKTDSELEDRVIRLIRRRRLPEPAVHFNVFHCNRWLGEVDLAYPRERLAIEVHGYGIHSLRHVWERDQYRENELVRAGWRLLKVTSTQLDKNPDAFTEALGSLLRPPGSLTSRFEQGD